MKCRLALLLITLMVTAVSARAQSESALSLEAKLAAAAPDVIRHWPDLPQDIRGLFLDHGIKGMANADEAFAASDNASRIAMDKETGQFVYRPAASIRLIFAVHVDAAWLVVYETGGFAHSFHLVEVKSGTKGDHFRLKYKVRPSTLASAIEGDDYIPDRDWSR